MKHLKTYEKLKEKYKVGDYIYFEASDDWLDIDSDSDWFKCYGQLIEKDDSRLYHDTFHFMCEYITVVNGKDFFDDDVYISVEEILRHLTPEEIEIYELKKISSKYNI